ncbi:hypothetical protein [Glaesserella parasuis]|uniref:hypothetical protein n=1 Tax=Glaesserella parasuis TaxID=738 RepID=UPI001319D81E|nr:hypothetical protein [Glaesserella parasuis]MDG6830849.1 hypothetical protein [Glaesserella parasuis]MDG6852561.1 hypothetical protein [Glaesserella parasuis]MDP0344528.1 hypothetical protein [Glaesserella parasuis]
MVYSVIKSHEIAITDNFLYYKKQQPNAFYGEAIGFGYSDLKTHTNIVDNHDFEVYQVVDKFSPLNKINLIQVGNPNDFYHAIKNTKILSI